MSIRRRRAGRLVCLGLCGTALILSAQEENFAVAGADHTVIRLGPGGRAVGSYWSGSELRGFLQSKGLFVSFNDDQSTATMAFGVNRAGAAVGGYRDRLSRVHGFVWNLDRRTVLDAPGATDTVALGIGDNGEVVGSFQSADCRVHGFRWNPAAGFTTVDAASPDVSTKLTAINAAGDMAGQYSPVAAAGGCRAFPLEETFTGEGRAFVFRGGAFTPIDVAGGDSSIALGFNEAGEVVGQYRDRAGRVRGFLAGVAGVETFKLGEPGAEQRLGSRANWFSLSARDNVR